MPFKSIYPFLAASVIFHATVVVAVEKGFPVFSSPAEQRLAEDGVYQSARTPQGVDVSLEKETAQNPVSRTVLKSYPANAAKKAVAGKAQAVPTRPAGAVRRPARDSAALLADPAVGKIFSSYFSAIKKKIRASAQESRELLSSQKGRTTVFFILRSDGVLDKAWVSSAETAADEKGRKAAVSIVEKSAPFGAFPPELGLERISFSVSVVFDEL